MSNKIYLIRWPDAVGLDISPTGHFQSRSVLAVVFGNNHGVRRYCAVLLAEVVLPESDLDCRTTSTDFGRYHLRRRLRRCQNRHLLLPDRLRTETDLCLRLNPEDVSLAWYEGLDDTTELVWSEVLHLGVSRALVGSRENIHVI